MIDKIYFPQSVPKTIVGTTRQSDIKKAGEGFGQILDQKLNNPIKFSSHAQQRLKSRNINLDAEQMNNLVTAVNKARDKGSKDSLILMNNLALVVSVKNNTVITAVDQDSLKDNVFTNIDSTVIV